MPRKGRPTNIYLPDDLTRIARKKFAKTGLSLSEAIREFLSYEVSHKDSLLDVARKQAAA